MGGIPHRSLRGKFLRRHPPGEEMVAGRESASLEHVIKHQQCGHDDNHGAHELSAPGLTGNEHGQFVGPAEKQVEHRTGGEPDGQMPAGDGPVRDDAVHEFGDSVDDAHQAEDDTETGVRDPILFPEGRHREGEVLAHEVEQRVAYHRTDDDPPLPVLECVLRLHTLLLFTSRDGRK